MGNVNAAGQAGVPPPPMGMPPPPPGPAAGAPGGGQSTEAPRPPPPAPDNGPGYFEDLHKKTKDLFPMPFEGAKLVINKGLSNHFQISHTMTMSSLSPSGYRFGCTYVGTQMFGPVEFYPVLVADLDPSGNLNANIVHQFTKSLRCKFVSQIQNKKWLATQLTTDYKGEDWTGSLTLGNIDIVSESGIMVLHYLQNITRNFAAGAELMYNYGPNVPGNELGVFSLAARYTGDNWQASANATPAAGGAHVCYYQKVNDSIQVGVEFEGSLRTQECTTTVGYAVELPSANVSFKGQLDSNWCVSALLEKRLPPLPFTLALSGFCNHVKSAYRFGVGLSLG